MKQPILLLLALFSFFSLAFTQSGIRGSYYSNTAFGSQPHLITIDKQIDFRWNGAPYPNFPSDYFTVRWEGLITLPIDGTYVFSVSLYDGARLWIDDHLLIDNWQQGNLNTVQAISGIPCSLAPCEYTLKLEYIHYLGQLSGITLFSESNHTARQVVPSSWLSPKISPAELKRQELRYKQANAGWGTWDNQNMLAHVHLPSSFSLNLGLYDFVAGDYLPQTIVFRQNHPAKVRPGPHSYEGSLYTNVSIFGWQGLSKLTVESTIVGDDIIILVTCTGNFPNLGVVVSPQFLWGRSGNISINPAEGTIGVQPSGLKPISVFGSQPTRATKLNILNIGFPLSGPIVISSGSQRSLSVATQLIKEAYNKQISYKARYHNLSDVYDAMQTVIAWNTIYDPHEGVVTPVSRGWNFGAGYVIFDWDNLFLAYMASLDNQDIAYSNIIQIIKARTIMGFVPNFASGLKKSEDRTEPPVGARILREIYNKYKDRWLVELLYDDLMNWNNWFWNHRRLAPLGLICLGSDPNLPNWNDGSVNTLQGARFESGLDNSPMYDPPVQFDTTTHQMQLYDVGFNSMFLMECEALIELGIILGYTEQVKILTARHGTILKLLSSNLWDQERGIFVNKISTSGQFYFRLSPTLFYPMLVKAATSEQADLMMKHLTSESGLCVHKTGQSYNCTWALPSIAINDPAYYDNNYWRGRIWGPMVQLVYWGLREYDEVPSVRDARLNLIEQSKQLLLKEWFSEGHVHENYNSTTGEGDDVGNSDPFYHWGALLGFIGILEQGYY